MGKLTDAVEKDLKYLRQYYPDLKRCGLTTMPTAVGMVADPQILNYPKEIRAKYSILLEIVYPDDFPHSPIKVYDMLKKINWLRLPKERRHIFNDGSLCTHHQDELIHIKSENRSLMIVSPLTPNDGGRGFFSCFL
ncbi:hypothetical protein [Syntrophaceticus schinkii]|uniref:Uncharacterized protein n=1 Tax=Syntrophaceticus schinkii TaxID=499207 RepID=A0A0B7MK68_9FIRM|nr:hypothetical protein [Syntrophaceticus schinkii]CEO90430.1 hypothetical protein SSCH_880001 [Syntrophaceticus schinkii]